jgi:hypothetical protein
LISAANPIVIHNSYATVPLQNDPMPVAQHVVDRESGGLSNNREPQWRNCSDWRRTGSVTIRIERSRAAWPGIFSENIGLSATCVGPAGMQKLSSQSSHYAHSVQHGDTQSSIKFVNPQGRGSFDEAMKLQSDQCRVEQRRDQA